MIQQREQNAQRIGGEKQQDPAVCVLGGGVGGMGVGEGDRDRYRDSDSEWVQEPKDLGSLIR